MIKQHKYQAGYSDTRNTDRALRTGWEKSEQRVRDGYFNFVVIHREEDEGHTYFDATYHVPLKYRYTKRYWIINSQERFNEIGFFLSV